MTPVAIEEIRSEKLDQYGKLFTIYLGKKILQNAKRFAMISTQLYVMPRLSPQKRWQTNRRGPIYV